MSRLFIGELARRAGLPVSTVRYYQRSGLLETPDRRDSGYRVYTESAVDRLTMIRSAQELGFTLRQIRTLLEVQANPQSTAAGVRQEALHCLTEVRAKLMELQAIEASLTRLVACCDGTQPVDQCPIIQSIQTHI